MSTPETVPETNTPETAVPQAPAAPPPTVLALTPKAVEMIKHTRQQEGLDPSHGLRVAVMGGGCSGFQYALDFEQQERDTDTCCSTTACGSSSTR